MDFAIEEHGFALARGVIDSAACAALVGELGPVAGAGRRRLLAIPRVAELAASDRVLNLVRPHLATQPVPTRAIYFDKSPASNWSVSWHQDITIAVDQEVDLPGFRAWCTKDGIPHVQPPVEFLAQMLTVRIHFDDANEMNGALRVVPGSHCHGRLTPPQVRDQLEMHHEHLCCAGAGDILLMRPLLLHSSGRSTSARHRRVLHIEYAGFELRPELGWHTGA